MHQKSTQVRWTIDMDELGCMFLSQGIQIVEISMHPFVFQEKVCIWDDSLHGVVCYFQYVEKFLIGMLCYKMKQNNLNCVLVEFRLCWTALNAGHAIEHVSDFESGA